MSAQRDCIHGHLARSCELCAAQNDHATACEQIDRLRAELAAERERADKSEAEVARLNKWADGMTDAVLKERETGEMYQRELRAERDTLRTELAALRAERDALRAAGKDALHALTSSRVFVTSRERCHHPDGTAWYDERVERLRAALGER